MPSKEDCKKILSKLGFKLGVSPKLIATRLLDDDDKNDMMYGFINIEELELAVKVWMDNGMPDYVEEKTRR